MSRLYGKQDSSLAAMPPSTFLALCYYDARAGMPQRAGIRTERVSMWVDADLNSSFVHGGTKASVPLRRLP